MSLRFITDRPRSRIFLAAACWLFPFTVYSIAFLTLGGDYFAPQNPPLATLGLDFLDAGPAVFAADLIARERFFFASTVMFAVCIAAFAYVIGVIFAARGGRVASVVFLVSCLVGLAAVITAGNAMREIAFDAPLTAAIAAKASYGLADFETGAKLFVDLNLFVGIGAVTAVTARFMDLALGEADAPQDAAALAARASALRAALFAGSALLTAATVATYFFHHYPVALMTAEAAELWNVIAGVASFRWGAAYTIILATTAAPAVAAHLIDRTHVVAAGAAAPAPAWLSRDGLLENLKLLATAASVLAPALASPIMDAAAPLLN